MMPFVEVFDLLEERTLKQGTGSWWRDVHFELFENVSFRTKV